MKNILIILMVLLITFTTFGKSSGIYVVNKEMKEASFFALGPELILKNGKIINTAGYIICTFEEDKNFIYCIIQGKEFILIKNDNQFTLDLFGLIFIYTKR